MAECKNCERSGWFLSLTKDGLCKDCGQSIGFEVSARAKYINEAIKVIDEGDKLYLQLSKCDLLIEQAKELVKYEQKGISTLTPSPSQIIDRYRQKKDDLLIKGFGGEIDEVFERIKILTPKVGINHLTKMLFKVRDHKNRSNNAGLLNDLEKRLSDAIHQRKLNIFLEDAKKYEFKGQLKKALDRYYEALYFLKHDEIDDTLQTENITTIEHKITNLEKGK